MVPIDLEPQPIILAYIDLNLQVLHFSESKVYEKKSSAILTKSNCYSFYTIAQTLAAARMLTPSGAVSQGHWSDSGQNGAASPVPHSNEAQLKVRNAKFHLKLFAEGFTYGNFRCHLKQQELAAIFKKIGDKQTCTIGLYELYRITQLYPQVSSHDLSIPFMLYGIIAFLSHRIFFAPNPGGHIFSVAKC
jgi:cytoskeleton-associated protein 5